MPAESVVRPCKYRDYRTAEHVDEDDPFLESVRKAFAASSEGRPTRPLSLQGHPRGRSRGPPERRTLSQNAETRRTLRPMMPTTLPDPVALVARNTPQPIELLCDPSN